MPQLGWPNEPDCFWERVEKVLALHGPQALGALADVRSALIERVLAMWVSAAERGMDLPQVQDLTRDYITGHPPPGA